MSAVDDCPACGRALPPPSANRRRRTWCSRECRRIAAGRSPKLMRELREEGDWLIAVTNNVMGVDQGA